MSTDEIISSKLPECLRRESGLHDVLIVRGIKDVVQDAFQDAQRAAILRFCTVLERDLRCFTFYDQPTMRDAID